MAIEPFNKTLGGKKTLDSSNPGPVGNVLDFIVVVVVLKWNYF